MKVTQCTGEGQGSCKRCSDCVKEIKAEAGVEDGTER